jgi:short-subunit dehydrogenase
VESYVLITGATGGLGKAFAVECANRGWNLFLTDLSEEQLCSLATNLMNTYGIRTIYFSCDLTDAAERQKLISHVHCSNISFSTLINVAGLDYEGLFSDRSPEQIRTLIRLNIEANLEITAEVLKLRNRIKPFRIINVASLAAYYSMPVKAMYAASKQFLLSFSMALREELKPYGVTVTALCPAGMPTTSECIKAIECQGFAGRITTKNVGYVAAKTIDHALKGHAVYIPGKLNQLLRLLSSLIPSMVLTRLIGSRWQKAGARNFRKLVDTI